MLVSTKPDSKGKAAVLARSAQLTDFKWTPLCDVPTYTKTDGKTVLPAGVEAVGMPYSSTEPVDKFITENVSFETFLSVAANPDSALYQKDLGGKNNSWTYIGIVCNGLVRYALGIRRRYSTKCWGDIPGMHMIAECESYKVDEIELCDILHAYGNGRNHVSLITDLLRDESGQIVQVEVSEAVRPTCKRACYSVEEFYEKYKLFALWRYDFVDLAPENDPEIDALLVEHGVEKELPNISVDYGNKSNYLEGEEIVISVFHKGENEVEICRREELVERLTVVGKGRISRKLERGYYTARLVNTGESIEFCVNSPQISHTVKGGYITVQAESCDPDSKILYIDFRERGNGVAALVKVEELSEEEKRSGVITRKIPDEGKNFKVYFENKYGIWTHRMIGI